jgi:transposase
MSAAFEQIDRHIPILDDEIPSLITADSAPSHRPQILASIARVGALTAEQLLTNMPELGCLDGKQAAPRTGLTPVTRQSGQWKGKSFIRGGRVNVRQASYMQALVAITETPISRSNISDCSPPESPQNGRHRQRPAQSGSMMATISSLVITDNLEWNAQNVLEPLASVFYMLYI